MARWNPWDKEKFDGAMPSSPRNPIADDVFEGMGRGVPGRAADDHKMPSAQWTDPQAILSDRAFHYDPVRPDGKIFLGRLGHQLIGVEDERHVLLCAGSRGFKGVSWIVPQLQSWEGSLVCIDTKSELSLLVADHRARYLRTTAVLLDPFGGTQADPRLADYRTSYNPLSILTPESETLSEDAGLIADALVIDEPGRNQFFADSAKALIEALILHIVTHENYEGRRNLVTLRELVRELDSHDLECEMQKNKAEGGIIQGGIADFWQRGDDERGSVGSTVRRATKWLDYRAMQRVVIDPEDPKKKFQLTDLKTKPGGLSLFVSLPAMRMAGVTSAIGWFRIIVQLAIEAMYREPRQDNQTLFMLDEYYNAVKRLESIEVASGLGGAGFKIAFVVQGLQQFKALHEDVWESMLGTCGHQIFFSNADSTSPAYIQKLCGQTTVIVERQSELRYPDRTDTAAGRSYGPETVDLITADEAARLFNRDDGQERMLVIRPGKDPMILQRVKYFRDRPFKDWIPKPL